MRKMVLVALLIAMFLVTLAPAASAHFGRVCLNGTEIATADPVNDGRGAQRGLSVAEGVEQSPVISFAHSC